MFFSIRRPETPKVAFVRIFTATALALALLLAVRAPASAAPICATHKEVTEQLANGFSEVPIAIALTSEGNVIVVFSPGDRATWTIVMTKPDGKSCIVAAGKTWESLPEVPSDPEA